MEIVKEYVLGMFPPPSTYSTRTEYYRIIHCDSVHFVHVLTTPQSAPALVILPFSEGTERVMMNENKAILDVMGLKKQFE